MFQKMFPALLMLLLLVACKGPHGDFTVQWPWGGASSSVASSSSSSSLPSETEPTFADDVLVTETGSEVTDEPEAISGALLERDLTAADLDIGLESAPMYTLYTHPSCAYCREFHEEHFARLLSDYVATGKLRVAVSIVPFNKYPMSNLQASALRCAEKEKRGREMLDRLFAHPQLSQAVLTQITKEMALPASFTTCVTSPEMAEEMANRRALYDEQHVSLVPTSFFGTEGQIGVPRYVDFRGWVESQL